MRFESALVVMLLGCLPVIAAAADPSDTAAPGATTEQAATPAGQTRAAPRHRGSPLEERVALLSAELDLDDGQQAAVRRILQDQRTQVMKAWSDPSVPAAYRISATKQASEQAADKIRAILNDTQKTKYLASRQPHAPATDADHHSVEDWMNAARAN